jgi:hypothetical protein
MMPPSTTPTIGEARGHEKGHGYGLVLFASIPLIVIGCFNLIQGIARSPTRTCSPQAPAPVLRHDPARPAAADRPHLAEPFAESATGAWRRGLL